MVAGIWLRSMGLLSLSLFEDYDMEWSLSVLDCVGQLLFWHSSSVHASMRLCVILRLESK